MRKIKLVHIATILTVIAIPLIVSAMVYIVMHPSVRPLPDQVQFRLALGFGLGALAVGACLTYQPKGNKLPNKIGKIFRWGMTIDGAVLTISSFFLL